MNPNLPTFRNQPELGFKKHDFSDEELIRNMKGKGMPMEHIEHNLFTFRMYTNDEIRKIFKIEEMALTKPPKRKENKSQTIGFRETIDTSESARFTKRRPKGIRSTPEEYGKIEIGWYGYLILGVFLGLLSIILHFKGLI